MGAIGLFGLWPTADALEMLINLNNDTREKYNVDYIIAGTSTKLRLG